MEQLEYVLAELKDVARELQEVVVQIDKLTGDMDLDAEVDAEVDESTEACSSCSSERGRPGLDTHTHTHTDTHTHTLHHHQHHHLLSHDTLSDSCSSGSAPENPLFASGTENLLRSSVELRGSQSQSQSSSCAAAQANGRNYLPPNSPKRTFFTPNSPQRTFFAPNSPKRTFFAPNSAQGSCYSPKGSGSRTSSPRGSFTSPLPLPLWVCVSGGHRRFSEQELDHALCCDDDDDDEDAERRSTAARSSRLSSVDSSVFPSPPLPALPAATLSPTPTRSCATQTASDKSTQTAWPYVSPKPRRPGLMSPLNTGAQRRAEAPCITDTGAEA